MTAWPVGGVGLDFGADYNPEQWPRDVWAEDVDRMRAAGVTMVSVGIFGWALLEPAEGRYELDWLSDVLDLLAAHGIRADLATATASPPPWFSRRYPESLPVTADGRRLWPGARQAYCPSSPAYRERALALVEVLARRFGDHDALALWHVGNEYGGHTARCYCDTSAVAFRRWLRRRYCGLNELNGAWGTAFWSQRYGDWEEVLPPRAAPTFTNPTQQLDFARFSSAELLDCFLAERDLLRRLTPDIPVTTNFMVMSRFDRLDYWRWAEEVDVVANDHYLSGDPEEEVELAMCADLTRGLARGRPWLLMEHATSAVSWQQRNLAKQPGQMRRNSLQHVAHGADGVMFFQWRASRAGAEKFHSALMPHAGEDTRVWREVVELGETLAAAGELCGSTVRAEVALLFDWEAAWACGLDAHPSVDVTHLASVRAWYRGLWRLGVTVDFVRPGADLTGYRLVVVPTLYLVTDDVTPTLGDLVAAGGHVVVTYFSGIVDEHDHVRLGGYPGAFRDLLGVRAEEFYPLPRGQVVRLDDGSRGTVWTELLHADDAEVVASYVDGPLPGVPAVTRRTVGRGATWYVATHLDGDAVEALLRRVLDQVEVRGRGAPAGVELVRRHGETASYLVAVNHTDQGVRLPISGVDLVSGQRLGGHLGVPAGGVAIVREETG